MIEVAPYFSLARAAWVACALTWDPDTGEFQRVEGPEGYEDYAQALEAGRRLTHSDTPLT